MSKNTAANANGAKYNKKMPSNEYDEKHNTEPGAYNSTPIRRGKQYTKRTKRYNKNANENNAEVIKYIHDNFGDYIKRTIERDIMNDSLRHIYGYIRHTPQTIFHIGAVSIIEGNPRIGSDSLSARVIITDVNIYALFSEKDTHDTYLLAPLYQFTSPLTINQIKYINNIFMGPKHPYKGILSGTYLTDRHTFEKLITYIPGNYIMPGFEPLDGLLGPYINLRTMEISALPPPINLSTPNANP